MKLFQKIKRGDKRILQILGLDVIRYTRVKKSRHAEDTQADNIITVAVEINDSIADILIGMAWIKDFYCQADSVMKIDIFEKKRPHSTSDAASLYSGFGFINNLYRYDEISGDSKLANINQYDIVLSISHFVKLLECKDSRVSKISPDIFQRVKSLRAFSQTYGKMTKSEWIELSLKNDWNRRSALGFNGAINFSRDNRGALSFDMEQLSALTQLGLSGVEYITLNAHDDHRISTDVEPHERLQAPDWLIVCRFFKERYPDLKIVGIAESFEKFDTKESGVDLELSGRLSLMEAAIVLKYGLLHIDTVSDFVHLRNQLCGKSLVLSDSPEARFDRYEENINILPSTLDFAFSQIDKSICEARQRYNYEVIAPELYTTERRNEFIPVLDELCAACEFERPPISEHYFTAESHVYMHASKQWEYPYAISKIKSLSKQHLKIADIGAGRGALSQFLAQCGEGHDVTVFDMSFDWDRVRHGVEKEFIDYAAKNNFSAKFGTIFNIPSKNEAYDVVTCISVVEHIKHKVYALTEMLRILKPGGLLILTYDLMKPHSENYTSAAMRIEIFTPEIIRETLQSIGAVSPLDLHPPDMLEQSLEDVLNDKVNITTGLTVGGFVIRKSQCSSLTPASIA